MKFDFCIGNPPYQQESEIRSETNGQAPRKNIFHYFQMEADKIATDSSVLIYPGGRWMHQSGKGMQEFGKNLINDPTLSTVEFYPDSKEIFGQAADLADGITIVVKKKSKSSTGFNYIYSRRGKEQSVHAENPGENLMPLNPNDLIAVQKIEDYVSKNNIGYLHDAILPRSLFAIESDFVEKNPDSVSLPDEKTLVDWNKKIRLLTNDKAGKAGRAKWYIADRSVITHNKEFIDEWKVIVSSANAGGQKRDNQIEIADNHSAFGRARVALRSFKTKKEAENFYKYCNTYLVKYAFLMTDEALTSLGKLVPDFKDYSDKGSVLTYDSSLDEQLFKLFELSEENISYIKWRVDNLRKRGNDIE